MIHQGNALDRRHLLGAESLEPDSLVCVNPYEVNPLTENSTLHCATLTADVPLKVESSLSQRSPDATSSGGFYGPQGKIKLEMEEFGDLSPFVSQKGTFTNSIDELNTPIFDNDAFDFDKIHSEKNVHADFHVMLKCDASFYRGGAHYASATYPQQRQEFNDSDKDIFLNLDSTRRNVTILPIENNKTDVAHAHIYSPPASETGTYIENVSPTTLTVLDYDMNNSVSVNLDSKNSSPYGHTYGQITPEGSEKSYVPDEHKVLYATPYNMKKPGSKLSLDINFGNLAMMGNQSTILDVSTPNLIAEVVNLEATGFNILDLINDDNIPVTTDDIFSTASLSNTQSHPKTHKVAVKQLRKRRSTKYDEDDDEEYVPPSKKSHSYQKKSRPLPREYDSSDSDSEEEQKPKKKSRGRPPKRTESISSDCSLGSDPSKYRELRDKNNEASRKSRLKRKLKELDLEKEADELHNKNIKLKAQVEELEKMVNNFRDNLFKIMINK